MRLTVKSIQERFSLMVSNSIAAGYRIVNARGNNGLSCSVVFSIEMFRDGKVLILRYESTYDEEHREHITIGTYSFEERIDDCYRIEDGEVLFRASFVEDECGDLQEEITV